MHRPGRPGERARAQGDDDVGGCEPGAVDGEPAGVLVDPPVDGVPAGAASVVPGAGVSTDSADSAAGASAGAAGPEATVVSSRAGGEDVPDVVTPAKSAELTGRPSMPITTGEFPSRAAAVVEEESSSTAGDVPPTPAITGIARTSTTTVVVTRAPSAKRPSRAGSVRRSAARRRSDQWVRAPEIRADSGGPEGRWCTRGLSGATISIRYRDETICVHRVTDSPWWHK